MPFFREDTDESIRHWLRIGLMGLLGIAVIAMLMSLVLGASRYLRMPDGVVHARKVPKLKAVSPEAFFEFLNTSGAAAGEGAQGAPVAESAKGVPATEATKGAAADGDGAQRFAGEVQELMKCAHEFATSVGRNQAEPDAAAMEDFRAQLVKVADASPDRGAAWATDVTRFVCAALDEKDAGDLAKAGRLDQPLVSAVNFHIAQWDAARQRQHDFEALEKKRLETEGVVAARRQEEARSGVSAAMSAVGTAFWVALGLAICLILMAIESHLRDIRDSFDELSLPDFGHASVPVVSEEVPRPAAAAFEPPAAAPVAAAAPPLAMADPLEVEYQIPEEAISRS